MHDLRKPAYSIKELEQALGVSHTTTYALIASGQLKTFKVGRRRLVSDEALREFIAKREDEAA